MASDGPLGGNTGEFKSERERRIRLSDTVALPTEADPGPPTVGRPILQVFSGRSNRTVHEIGDREVLIGRGAECDLVFDDCRVSRRHAKVVPEPQGGVAIEDLGSANGTAVNGKRIHRTALRDGDRILLGTGGVLKFAFEDWMQIRFLEALCRDAASDPLTGVPNKGGVLERLSREFAYSVRHGTPVSLMLLDVDRFKSINDTYGHAAGDAVLVQLADAVAKSVRTEDTFGRFGGEEFLILTRLSAADAVRFAERIRGLVGEMPFQIRDLHGSPMSLRVTVSIGAACLQGNNYADNSEFLNAADQALYQAKSGGRNRVCLHAASAGDPTRP